MSEKKPQVFPVLQKTETSIQEELTLEQYEAKKNQVTSEIFNNAKAPEDLPKGQADAVEAMRRRTESQLRMRDQFGKVVQPELAEKPISAVETKTQEQISLRD